MGKKDNPRIIRMRVYHLLAVVTLLNINEQQYVKIIIPIPNLNKVNHPIICTYSATMKLAIITKLMLKHVKSKMKLPSQ